MNTRQHPAQVMSRTKQQCIADAIAKRIMANTRKRYSTLHAEALEETAIMSETSLQHPLTDAQKEAEQEARLAALEAAVAELQAALEAR